MTQGEVLYEKQKLIKGIGSLTGRSANLNRIPPIGF